jgi:hypothetical protein
MKFVGMSDLFPDSASLADFINFTKFTSLFGRSASTRQKVSREQEEATHTP